MKLILFVVVTMLSTLASAQSSSMPLSKFDDVVSFPWVRESRTSVRPYFGLSLGSTADRDDTLAPNGPPAKLHILGSLNLPSQAWIADAGLGLFNQTFSQNAAGADRVSALSMDLSVRWSTTDRWQFGPALLTLFNQGGAYGTAHADVQFGGVQVLREFNLDRRHVARFGGRVVGGLNAPVNMALVDFQVGWDSSRKDVTEKRVVRVVEN